VIEEFRFACANGISTETDNVTDEGDAVVSDGEGEETSDVSLVALVETLKQQPARRLMIVEIVLNRLTATHDTSLKPKREKRNITNSAIFS